METPRVLLIDDNIELLELMRDAFEDEGMTVDIAADGLAGSRAFEAAHPDLVVTDILMPGREGIETIIELRRQGARVKILAISGGGRLGAPGVFLDLASRFGADAVLAKPFKLDELIAQARGLLACDDPIAV